MVSAITRDERENKSMEIEDSVVDNFLNAINTNDCDIDSIKNINKNQIVNNDEDDEWNEEMTSISSNNNNTNNNTAIISNTTSDTCSDAANMTHHQRLIDKAEQYFDRIQLCIGVYDSNHSYHSTHPYHSIIINSI